MNRLEQIQQQVSNSTKFSVEFEDEGRIGVIYLNSPKDYNSLSITMRQELISALKALERNSIVKVVVILSKIEKIFCAGANIKELNTVNHEDQMHSGNIDIFNDFDQAISTYKKPIISGVQGGCFGGGFEIALASDILIAREDAKFGLPEINLGLIPGLGGTIRLTKIVGKPVASRLILSGEPITAKRAHELQIVSEVLPKENFHQNVINIAKKISSKGLFPLITAKKAISASQEMGVAQGLKIERTLIQGLYDSKAKKEGTDAFIQKRKPNFNDC